MTPSVAMRGFLFDPNRCTGCAACRLACTIENELPPGTSWRRIETYNPRHLPGQPLYHLSLACNHCAEPACMHACPALAYARDAATGAVLLDPDRCIGCGYCAWACPYDAPVFDDAAGVMTKCTWCHGRLARGLDPACVALCPTGALGFGELASGPPAAAIDGFPRTGLGPRIRIEPLRDGRRLPEMAAGAEPALTDQAGALPAPGISLRREWSLAAFTLLAAVLVAAFAAAATSARQVGALTFGAASALALALASAHLGRPARAWRAALNLRRSWLSREVVVLSVFFGAATSWLALAPGRSGAGVPVAAVGFAGLLCADRVYGVLGRAGPGHRHSASVLWTGLFLGGIFAGRAGLALILGAAKLALYVTRKRRFSAAARPVRPLASAARVVVGFAVPAALWAAGGAEHGAWIAATAVAGEAIDRAEYYLELERESPRRALAETLLARSAR